MDKVLNLFNTMSNKVKYLSMALGGIILLIIPLISSSNYFLGIMCRILLYIILAGSLNVINGYTNQFSIGHAGLMAVGAYTGAILQTRFNVSFWIAIFIAAIFASLIGFLISIPTYKLSGIYLSIVTLGFSEIIRLISLNWTPVTGGPLGIKNIPAPVLFSWHIRKANEYYYVFLFFALLFLFITHRVLKSRVGRAWMSIREDQLAARSLGVEITKYKALNFIYGAFFAGLAGAIYAPYLQYIDSTIFTLDEGFNILSMVIIGGMGTLVGPIVGSTLVNVLNEVLRPISQYRLVAYGVLIIVMMWWRPQGLVGASNSVLSGRKDASKKDLNKKAAVETAKE